MQFLYHRVPACMEGTHIHPLRILQRESPALYERAIAKYVPGREDLPQRWIPQLDCQQQDVVFLTAVHPSTLRKAFAETGVQFAPAAYYQVPLQRVLAGGVAIVMRHKKREVRFEALRPEKLKDYTDVPTRTRKYYAQCAGEGLRPLIFHGIPQILYRGSLDISACEKVLC